MSTPIRLYQTAFPYLSGIAHLGTLSQAIRTSLTCQLADAFGDDCYTPYSFHLTGIPSYHKIKHIQQAHARGELTMATRHQIYEKQGLSALVPLLGHQLIPRDIGQWVSLFVAYYTRVFQEIGLKTSLTQGLYHTTTDIDSGYTQFVRAQYADLAQRGLLYQGKKQIITCDTCEIILGDHERTAGQGLGVVYQHTAACTPAVGDYVMSANWTGRVTEESIIPPGNYASISGQIRCRCGGRGMITSKRTYFIRIDDAWKRKACALLQETLISDQGCRKIIEKAIWDMRDYSFLRDNTHGWGSTLPVLEGTGHETDLVDPLGDSMTHIWHAAKLVRDYRRSQVVPAIYYTSVDLLSNHVALMVLIHALYETPMPALAINGFLLGTDGGKMSKSRGNVITWQTLRDRHVSGPDLIYFISQVADTSESSSVSVDDILQVGRSASKQFARLVKKLQTHHITPQALEVLAKIRTVVRPWEATSPHPKVAALRYVGHLLLYELKQCLGVDDHGLDDHKTIARKLIRAFGRPDK